MTVREINFDGIIGPSHNYAGLSLGNLAAMRNARRRVAAPRGGVAGHRQDACQPDAGAGAGPVRAPAAPGARLAGGAWQRRSRKPTPELAANAMSASAMWAANAATVSPAPDTADGKCHLTVANLRTMPHRSHEWTATLAQLELAFADPAFAVHWSGAAGVRRRGRGQSHAADVAPRRAGHGDCSSTGGPAVPSPPASISRRRRRSRGFTGSIRRGPCSSSSPRKRLPRELSTMT